MSFEKEEVSGEDVVNSPYRLMIVDDSKVIRNVLASILADEPRIEIVEFGENGADAIDKLSLCHPEIMMLDVEMPEMDGLTAIPRLLKIDPELRIVMVSTLTKHNAATSVAALSLGAADYIEKPEANFQKDKFRRELVSKLIELGKSRRRNGSDSATAGRVVLQQEGFPRPQALAIGSSTGGPQALIEVFEAIRDQLSSVPIFITQHMPESFTSYFANHLEKVSGIECHEAQDGEVVEPGIIYIAPGDYHMEICKADTPGQKVIRLTQEPPENFCRPSVDPMFRSVADAYGSNVLALILTGMGRDGVGGCKAINDSGGQIVIQNKDTSVVWGMPGAVAEAKLFHAMLPIEEIAPYLIEAF